MFGIVQNKREIGNVSRLSGQRPVLRGRRNGVPVHSPLLRCDSGMGESIVALYSEPTEILQNVNFSTGVVGRSQVQRSIIQVLTFADEAVLYRVLDVLVEKANHNLL